MTNWVETVETAMEDCPLEEHRLQLEKRTTPLSQENDSSLEELEKEKF